LTSDENRLWHTLRWLRSDVIWRSNQLNIIGLRKPLSRAIRQWLWIEFLSTQT
jgi:hypothetical protein